jgi:mediator of RNA polymerase II transcription subunit 16, fungi type
VVDALAGCARWSIDLLSWLADSLFGLIDDNQFMSYVRDPNKFHLISSYLQEKNDPSLHLVMCSTMRGLVVAVCRRLQHLEALGNKAIEFWENRMLPGHPERKTVNLRLYQAYLRVQKLAAGSPVKVKEFEELLNNLSSDIRITYSAALVSMVCKGLNQPPPQPGAAINKALDNQIKMAQMRFEVGMLLGGPIAPMFYKAVARLFAVHLSNFRQSVDQSVLFFNDNSLLEVVTDNKATLDARRARGAYVDVFRKEQLEGGPRQASDGGENNRGQAPTFTGHWRRCTRCCAVMEDCVGNRPGFNFVLSQQRKCACGGAWCLLPKGQTMI